MKEAIARAGCERREAQADGREDGEAGFLEVCLSFSFLFLSFPFFSSCFHLDRDQEGFQRFSKNGLGMDELIHFFNRWRIWRNWHRNYGWISEAGWNRRSRETEQREK